MNVAEAIQTRRSTRHYDTTRPLERRQIEELIELANLAPSSFNFQHWKFIVVHEGEQKKRIRVVPIRTTSPSSSSQLRTTASLTRVPFLLPRSSITNRPDLARINRACCRDAPASSRGTSHSASRPIVADSPVTNTWRGGFPVTEISNAGIDPCLVPICVSVPPADSTRFHSRRRARNSSIRNRLRAPPVSAGGRIH